MKAKLENKKVRTEDQFFKLPSKRERYEFLLHFIFIKIIKTDFFFFFFKVWNQVIFFERKKL